VLLHVLRKVRFLGVRLATVGADVSLNMFRIAMLGDVLQEGGLVREALVAGVALVRLVALVAPRVGLQVGQLGERLRATWMATLVRLVPGVSPDVLLQVGELGELALADLTTVRLDPQVDSHVLRKIGAVGEGLAALTALVRLGLAHVDLGVQLQVGF